MIAAGHRLGRPDDAVRAGPIGRFVSDHPTIKMLALSFLVVVGVVLIAEGLDHHVPKGYVYFAMAFSVGGDAQHPHAVRHDTRQLPRASRFPETSMSRT
jgi:predicted tellurium resistance membrane protein TerC